MTATEAALQARLDTEPDNHTIREVLADLLDEIGDPRALGYRALGVNGIVPAHKGKQWYFVLDHKARLLHELYDVASTKTVTGDITGILSAAIPHGWFKMLVDCTSVEILKYWNWTAGWCAYGKSRREAEYMLTAVFPKLPPEQQAAILASAASVASAP